MGARPKLVATKRSSHRVNLAWLLPWEFVKDRAASASMGAVQALRRAISADREETPGRSVSRERSGDFAMADPKEVAGLPPGMYTKDILPKLSEDTQRYLLDLRRRAEKMDSNAK